MTPDKRLDQIEPVLADVAQKTDRLIESNGQILEVALRADTNAKIAAKGVADLTVEMRQQFGQVGQRFDSVDQQFEQQQNQIDGLRQEVQQGFQEVNQKFAQVEKTQQQILTLLLDRLS
ncbi:hypothetical protein [Spirosoma jeollabukense]